MSDELPKTEVKWWDKKVLIRSALVGLAFYGLFWALTERAKPPAGYVFERLPPINGVYKCCEAGGRYSRSWVGGTVVSCTDLNYFPFLGTNRNDCGLKEQLNGRTVEVVEVHVPTITVSDPTLVKITSGGVTYQELDDRQIRERWIRESRGSAFSLAFILAAIFHGAQLIYLDRKLKKTRSKQMSTTTGYTVATLQNDAAALGKSFKDALMDK